MSQHLPLEQAAQALDVPPGTLRKWKRRGCPTVCPGGKGRGHPALFDVAEVQAWREAKPTDAMVLELAQQLPDVLAQAMAQAVAKAEGVDRCRLAGIMCAAWYLASCAVMDKLQDRCASVPDVRKPLPEAIQRLEKIARN